MKFLSKDFNSREELDKAVLALAGSNIDDNRKAGHTIEGTEKDLLRLQLDATTTVWGVGVKVLDNPLYSVTPSGIVKKIKK